MNISLFQRSKTKNHGGRRRCPKGVPGVADVSGRGISAVAGGRGAAERSRRRRAEKSTD